MLCVKKLKSFLKRKNENIKGQYQKLYNKNKNKNKNTIL